jgi:hypothetical protein
MNLVDLHRLTAAVNVAAFEETGHRANCILASGALMDVLHARGVEARCIRAEVVATPRDGTKHLSRGLGMFGDGSRQPAAAPGMWHGHLVVVAGDVLLDPTLDNIADAPGYEYLRPFAARLAGELEATRWYDVDPHGVGVEVRRGLGRWPYSDVRYKLFPCLGGWKSAGMFRRRIRARVAAMAVAA